MRAFFEFHLRTTFTYCVPFRPILPHFAPFRPTPLYIAKYHVPALCLGTVLARPTGPGLLTYLIVPKVPKDPRYIGTPIWLHALLFSRPLAASTCDALLPVQCCRVRTNSSRRIRSGCCARVPAVQQPDETPNHPPAAHSPALTEGAVQGGAHLRLLRTSRLSHLMGCPPLPIDGVGTGASAQEGGHDAVEAMACSDGFGRVV